MSISLRPIQLLQYRQSLLPHVADIPDRVDRPSLFQHSVMSATPGGSLSKPDTPIACPTTTILATSASIFADGSHLYSAPPTFPFNLHATFL